MAHADSSTAIVMSRAGISSHSFSTPQRLTPSRRMIRSENSHIMRTSLVITVIGDDRPGIVEQLSEQVLAVNGNWEESRMARLAGKFAGLLRVSVDADRADALERGLTSLHTAGLTIVAVRSAEAPPQTLRTF